MIGHIDMVFANAGVTEKERFLPDMIPVDGDGQPREPTYPILDVNLKSVLNVIKLSWNIMRSQEGGGSIVLTASSTAYAPEATIPLYSALKATVSLSFSEDRMHLSILISSSAHWAGSVATPLSSLGRHHHQRRGAKRDRNTPLTPEIHRSDQGGLLTCQHARIRRTSSRVLGHCARRLPYRFIRHGQGVGRASNKAVERQSHHDAREFVHRD